LLQIPVIAISILGAFHRGAAMQHRFPAIALQHTMLRRTKVLAPASIRLALSRCFDLAVWLGDNPPRAPHLRRKATLNNRIRKQDLVRA
jgi:hypothetical protein